MGLLELDNGTAVCRQAFDPWGRRRDPATLAIDDNALSANYVWLCGFTGHEHLPQFGLINMNARLYDPLLGRMLSPDNYVTDASNPMAYNLYSYANNNPLSNIDPSGNFIWTLITAVVDFWTQGFSGGFYRIDGYGFSYAGRRINYNRQLNRLGVLEFLGAMHNPFVIFFGNNP